MARASKVEPPVLPRLTDAEVFRVAARYERAAGIEGRVKRIKQECSALICGELELRGVATLDGEDATVTRVQAVTIEAHELAQAVPAEVRRELFREEFDLNALPDDVKRKLVGKLKPEERAAVTRYVIADTEAFDAAVGKKRIPARTLRRFEKRGSAYVKVSHGAKKAKAGR